MSNRRTPLAQEAGRESLRLALSRHDVAILLELSRQQIMSTTLIRELILPDIPERTMYHNLRRLVVRGLIWRTWTATADDVPGKRTPRRTPCIYGLTEEGRAVLAVLNGETAAAVDLAACFREDRALLSDETTLHMRLTPASAPATPRPPEPAVIGEHKDLPRRRLA